MAYSRDVVVDCIKRYYDLLVRAAYLDPADVQHPPNNGWSDEQLAVDILRAIGRSDEVIDLLRHLPYITQPPSLDKYEVYLETESANYLRSSDLVKDLTVEDCQEKDLCELLLMPLEAEWPASFISLSHGRDGTWWIIDTAEGIMYPVGTDNVCDDPPEDQPWLEGSVPRNIQEFFDELYDEVESLKMVPVPKGEKSWYCQILPCEWEKGRIVKRLLKEHGWPENLNKEEYHKALSKVHPDSVPR